MSPKDTNRTGLSRRTVLRRAGGLGALAAGAAVLSGPASANKVTTVAFCGCSQVVVYGETFVPDGTYKAVLYCGDPPGGDVSCVELAPTDGDTRRSYEVGDQDCKIIGLIGTTFRDGNFTPDEVFTVCNTYGPQQCAQRVLEHYGGAVETGCDISIRYGEGTGQAGEIRRTFDNVTLRCPFYNVTAGEPEDPGDFGITVRSGGCGPEDAGPPGRARGPPEKDTDSQSKHGGDPPVRGSRPPGRRGGR